MVNPLNMAIVHVLFNCHKEMAMIQKKPIISS